MMLNGLKPGTVTLLFFENTKIQIMFYLARMARYPMSLPEITLHISNKMCKID
jgi:hypothetical protein